jgi:hypothetical protein
MMRGMGRERLGWGLAGGWDGVASCRELLGEPPRRLSGTWEGPDGGPGRTADAGALPTRLGADRYGPDGYAPLGTTGTWRRRRLSQTRANTAGSGKASDSAR